MDAWAGEVPSGPVPQLMIPSPPAHTPLQQLQQLQQLQMQQLREQQLLQQQVLLQQQQQMGQGDLQQMIQLRDSLHRQMEQVNLQIQQQLSGGLATPSPSVPLHPPTVQATGLPKPIVELAAATVPPRPPQHPAPMAIGESLGYGQVVNASASELWPQAYSDMGGMVDTTVDADGYDAQQVLEALLPGSLGEEGGAPPWEASWTPASGPQALDMSGMQDPTWTSSGVGEWFQQAFGGQGWQTYMAPASAGSETVTTSLDTNDRIEETAPKQVDTLDAEMDKRHVVKKGEEISLEDHMASAVANFLSGNNLETEEEEEAEEEALLRSPPGEPATVPERPDADNQASAAAPVAAAPGPPLVTAVGATQSVPKAQVPSTTASVAYPPGLVLASAPRPKKVLDLTSSLVQSPSKPPQWQATTPADSETEIRKGLERGEGLFNLLKSVPLPPQVDNMSQKQVQYRIVYALDVLYKTGTRPTLVALQQALHNQGAPHDIIKAVLPICARAPELYKLWLSACQICVLLNCWTPSTMLLTPQNEDLEAYDNTFLQALVSVLAERLQSKARPLENPRFPEGGHNGADHWFESQHTEMSTKKPAAGLKEKLFGSHAGGAAELASAFKERGVTTLMLRNLPQNVTQLRFVEELSNTGFAGLYDFCYMPSTFRTGTGKGYAFVNLVSADVMSNFVKVWHGARLFGMMSSDTPINVSAAAIQGREENARKWDAPRMRRVRNPALRPLVLADGVEYEDGQSPRDAVSSPESASSGSYDAFQQIPIGAAPPPARKKIPLQ